MSESVYVGNAREKETPYGKVGMLIEIDLAQLNAAKRTDAFQDATRVWIDKTGGERRMLKLAVWPLKEPSEYRTHSVKLDTFKPAPKEAGYDGGADNQAFPRENDDQDDLPF